jgi:hypothetical protein
MMILCCIQLFYITGKGVAILFHSNFDYKVHKTVVDDSGNLIALGIEVKDQLH